MQVEIKNTELSTYNTSITHKKPMDCDAQLAAQIYQQYDL